MRLAEFFQKYPELALAFSGGVDSAYLLYAARKCGADVHAYYVKSAFQPRFELEDAKRLASQLGAAMTVIDVDILSCADVTANPPDRCYHCKQTIFQAIMKQAAEDGYDMLIDGTNASDDAGDRPGMQALRELAVRSPLRECGLSKEEIRQRSKEVGLFTWDKPAYACLATRIPAGETITKEKLERTEQAEDFLFSLGFTDFRVRSIGDAASLQILSSQIGKLIIYRRSIVHELKKYYSSVMLDMEVRDE